MNCVKSKKTKNDVERALNNLEKCAKYSVSYIMTTQNGKKKNSSIDTIIFIVSVP